MRPPRGVDGSSADRWHPGRPDAQRLWLGIYRSARWCDRFLGDLPRIRPEMTAQRRRMTQWAVQLTASRTRRCQRRQM
jgi:hypothetical protein